MARANIVIDLILIYWQQVKNITNLVMISTITTPLTGYAIVSVHVHVTK